MKEYAHKLSQQVYLLHKKLHNEYYNMNDTNKIYCL